MRLLPGGVTRPITISRARLCGEPVGASLLAMRPFQPASMLNGRPLSRASSLPQRAYFLF
ncbi:hypothetical protein C1C98_14250 [Pseudomonas ogarae]|uniref:DUF1534 domain-containing protein n=1 Tax=Pseudomonas ogarae (strain DSM 112162 / CECT 30235 / F113) TaxID=1114970 RepID=A0ABN5G6N3_PSEO1|nr:hypothetical protein C1C98_14250 [Pseudomonas ogarae]